NMTSLSVSYNNNWHGVSYSLSYSMNKNTQDSNDDGESVSNDNQFALSVSVPLDRWMHNTWATYNMNNTKEGTTQNLRLHGTAVSEELLNCNLQEGFSNTRTGNSTSLNADCKATYGEESAGVGQDKYPHTHNDGLQGGII